MNIYPMTDTQLDNRAMQAYGAINKSYPKGYVYDQLAFNTWLGSYELDPNFCVGCAVANAVQGLLLSVGIPAHGDYGKLLYETAKLNQVLKANVSSIRIEPVIECLPEIFGPVLEGRGVQIVPKRIKGRHVRRWIADQSPVVCGMAWTEGMAYPAPRVVSGWWRKVREFFRGARMMSNTGRRLGFHCVCLIGLRDSRKAYDVENSYGLGWGNKGKALLPYHDLPDAAELWGFELLKLEEGDSASK
jgi:hypothetical protein